MSTMLPFKRYFEDEDLFYNNVDGAIQQLSKNVSDNIKLALEDDGSVLKLTDFFLLKYYNEVKDVNKDNDRIPIFDEIENFSALDPKITYFDKLFGWTPHPDYGNIKFFFTSETGSPKTIFFRLVGTIGEDIVINWGDGFTDTITVQSAQPIIFAHQYFNDGIYLITINSTGLQEIYSPQIEDSAFAMVNYSNVPNQAVIKLRFGAVHNFQPGDTINIHSLNYPVGASDVNGYLQVVSVIDSSTFVVNQAIPLSADHPALVVFEKLVIKDTYFDLSGIEGFRRLDLSTTTSVYGNLSDIIAGSYIEEIIIPYANQVKGDVSELASFNGTYLEITRSELLEAKIPFNFAALDNVTINLAFNNLSAIEVDLILKACTAMTNCTIILAGNASRTPFSDVDVKTIIRNNNILVVSEDNRYDMPFEAEIITGKNPAAPEGYEENTLTTPYFGEEHLLHTTPQNNFDSITIEKVYGDLSIYVSSNNAPTDGARFFWELVLTATTPLPPPPAPVELEFHYYRLNNWIKHEGKKDYTMPLGKITEAWCQKVFGDRIPLRIEPDTFEDWVNVSIYHHAVVLQGEQKAFELEWTEDSLRNNGGFYIDGISLRKLFAVLP